MNMPDYYEEERELPHSLETEQALLGAILNNNTVLEHVIEFLEPEDFANVAHADIYAECKKLFERGKVFTPVTLYPKFKSHPELAEVGGSTYLNKLMINAISVLGAPDYGRLVKDHSIRRKMISLSNKLMQRAYDTSTGSCKEILEELESDVQGLYGIEQQKTALQHISISNEIALSEAREAMNRDGSVAGVTTGLRGLDAATGGLHAGQMIVMAARPAMGKTALALNIARGAAQANHTVGIFSLEMGQQELSTRLAADLIYSSQNTVSYFNAKNGNLTRTQFEKFEYGLKKADKLPIYLTDKGGYTIASLRLEITRLKRKLAVKQKSLDLVIIDYMQLMGASSKYRGNKVQEVSEISAGIKRLAKEFEIPIVVLSQLSRSPESREDKRPILSDLRDSGSIEQDADTVIFLYREHYYLSTKEPKDTSKHTEWLERCERTENKLDVIIAKQRLGATSTKYFDYFKEANAIRDGLHDAQNGVR